MAGVIDTTSSVMEVVVNGRMVSSQATNGPLLTNTTPLTIGASDVGNNFFIGLIDEVQIYNVALPSTAIASLLGGPSIGPATDQRGAARVARRTSTSVQRNFSLTCQSAAPPRALSAQTSCSLTR